MHVPVHTIRGAQPLRREVVTLEYATDPSTVRRLLPEPLEPVGATASVQACRYFDIFGEGSHVEISQNIKASLNGVVGDFVLSVYTAEVGAIMLNRDVWVLPILPGDARMYTDSHTLVLTLDIGTIRVLNATAAYKDEPLSIEDGERQLMLPKYCLRMNSSPTSLDGRNASLLKLVPKMVEVSSVYQSPARMQMFDHVMAPLADLPVFQLEPAIHTVAVVTPSVPIEMHRYS